MSQSLWNRAVSYDEMAFSEYNRLVGLNPFGTGQCLTTNKIRIGRTQRSVSIPLEQGSVLR